MKKWEVIGAPFDLSANERGASLAPDKIRDSYLSTWIERFKVNNWGIDIVDGGNVDTSKDESATKYFKRLYDRVSSSLSNKNIPVIIGGDHSISLATVSAASSYLKDEKPGKTPLGVLWLDAHADLNTAKNDNLHGKPAAILLGEGVEILKNTEDYLEKIEPENFYLIGVQDLMPTEYELIRKLSLKVNSIRDIDNKGLKYVVEDAISGLEKTTDGFFVSLDIDVCAGELYGACATPMVGGLTSREICQVVEIASKSDKFLGIDIVEYCPEKDKTGNTMNLITNILHRLFEYTTKF